MGLAPSPVYIGVVGPDPAPKNVAGRAEEVGKLLAKAGAVLVCGGLGGVMEAAAPRAAAEAGTSIGLLPGTSRAVANRHLTLSIPTGMGEMRNVLVVRASDAVIALAGEFGTLSEIALALKTGVPVVGLETWELAKAGKRVEPFLVARSPEEAVGEALRLAAATSHDPKR
jgi:uncharacterized protein (TIGR00725 family)